VCWHGFRECLEGVIPGMCVGMDSRSVCVEMWCVNMCWDGFRECVRWDKLQELELGWILGMCVFGYVPGVCGRSDSRYVCWYRMIRGVYELGWCPVVCGVPGEWCAREASGSVCVVWDGFWEGDCG